MSLLTARIYFIFLKNVLTQASVEKWEKQLASKANFSTFLQLSCLNFRLKLCEKP